MESELDRGMRAAAKVISRDSKLMGSRCAGRPREVPNDREASEGLHKLCADLVVRGEMKLNWGLVAIESWIRWKRNSAATERL